MGGWVGVRVKSLEWDTICKQKTLGGLGVEDLECFNKALLGKWIWRFYSEKGIFGHTS